MTYLELFTLLHILLCLCLLKKYDALGITLHFQTHSVIYCSDSQSEKFPRGTYAVARGYKGRLWLSSFGKIEIMT